MISGCVCGGGLLSREIKLCPICGKVSRRLTQFSFGGYVTTSFCGSCGGVWQDGEKLNQDRTRIKKYVHDNWKHGRKIKIVLKEIFDDMTTKGDEQN